MKPESSATAGFPRFPRDQGRISPADARAQDLPPAAAPIVSADGPVRIGDPASRPRMVTWRQRHRVTRRQRKRRKRSGVKGTEESRLLTVLLSPGRSHPGRAITSAPSRRHHQRRREEARSASSNSSKRSVAKTTAHSHRHLHSGRHLHEPSLRQETGQPKRSSQRCRSVGGGEAWGSAQHTTPGVNE